MSDGIVLSPAQRLKHIATSIVVLAAANVVEPAAAKPGSAYSTTFMQPRFEKTFDVLAGYKTAHKAPPIGSYNRDKTDLVVGQQLRGLALMGQAPSAADIKMAADRNDPASLRVQAWDYAIQQASLMKDETAIVKLVSDVTDVLIESDSDEAKSTVSDYVKGKFLPTSPIETLRSGKGNCVPKALLTRAGISAAGIDRGSTALSLSMATLDNGNTDLHLEVVFKMKNNSDLIVNNFQPTVMTAPAFFAKKNLVYDGIKNFKLISTETENGVQIYSSNRMFVPKDKPVTNSAAQSQVISEKQFKPDDSRIYHKVMDHIRSLNYNLKLGEQWIVPPPVNEDSKITPSGAHGTSAKIALPPVRSY